MNQILTQLKEQESKATSRLEELAVLDTFTEENEAEFNRLEKEIPTLKKRINVIETAEELKAGKRGYGDGELREISKYSIKDALNAALTGHRDGIVLEMHQEGEKEAKEAGMTLAGHSRSVVIPQKFLFAPLAGRNGFKLDVTAGTPNSLGSAIENDALSFIDYLWNNTPLARMGVDFLYGLVGNIPFLQEATKPATAWGAENATLSETTPTGTLVTMSPKRLGAFMDVSNQLLRQTSPSVEARLARNLLSAVGEEINSVAIAGGGTSEPDGILATSGIGDVAGGTNGLAPTHSHILELEEKLAIANADIGSVYYLTNAKVRRQLKETAIEAGDAARVWSLIDKETPLNSYQAEVTNLVPSDLTKGTATSVCSAIIHGNFNDLIVGQWGGLEVMPNEYTKMKEGITEMIVNAYIDTLVTRPASFVAMKDALTA